MFGAVRRPILRMPTRSYRAGVPADFTPAIRWKLTGTFAWAAGPAAARRARTAVDVTARRRAVMPGTVVAGGGGGGGGRARPGPPPRRAGRGAGAAAGGGGGGGGAGA